MYLSTPIAVVGKSLMIDKNSILASSALHPSVGEYISTAFSENEIIVFPSVSEAYSALDSGEIDYVFENIYAVRETLFSGDYGYFAITSVLAKTDDFSYLFREDIDPRVISIFNKAIAALDVKEIEKMLFYSATEISNATETALFVAEHSGNVLVGSITLLTLLVLALITGLIIQVKMKNKLWKLAYIDELTGLPNLSLFKLKAKEILEKRGSQKYVAIKLDIVKFNTINGVYGMETGDKILRLIAECAQHDLNHHDELCARIGIDAFVVLFAIDKDEDSNNRVAQFSNVISEKLDFQLRFHVGRYIIPANENDIDVIYEKVGFAHHYARQNANTPIIFDYDGTAREIELRHREIDSLMEDALINEDYVVYLQGKYNIHTGELCGAEALVRWQFADGTPVSLPSEFIPLFERNGFITTLDYYIFENCCRILRSWIDEGKRVVTISVNFSRLHLQEPHFIQTLVNTAEKYNIPKRLLEIELTESAMFDNIETLVSVLAELHEAGFTLSMDDFGAGYSSLGLLKDLPVDVIKLDRSFFVGSRDKARSKVVLASIFSMAKSLNIKTLAEGVEYEDQVLLLRGLGCEVVQGFFFAKPIKYDEFSFDDKPMDF